MSRVRFVSAATVRLDLSEGDWIEIKEELSVQDEKSLESSPMTGVRDIDPEHPREAEVGLDWGKYYIKKLVTWLVDWSFVDVKGKPVPCTQEAIKALRGDDAREIMDAVNEYITQQEEKKKGATGKTASETQSS